MKKELIAEAREIFGREVVSEVIAAVEISDADCAYTTFQDMKMEDHAECVEYIFF